jgi:hypothetical protein
VRPVRRCGPKPQARRAWAMEVVGVARGLSGSPSEPALLWQRSGRQADAAGHCGFLSFGLDPGIGPQDWSRDGFGLPQAASHGLGEIRGDART